MFPDIKTQTKLITKMLLTEYTKNKNKMYKTITVIGYDIRDITITITFDFQ